MEAQHFDPSYIVVLTTCLCGEHILVAIPLKQVVELVLLANEWTKEPIVCPGQKLQSRGESPSSLDML